MYCTPYEYKCWIYFKHDKKGKTLTLQVHWVRQSRRKVSPSSKVELFTRHLAASTTSQKRRKKSYKFQQTT